MTNLQHLSRVKRWTSKGNRVVEWGSLQFLCSTFACANSKIIITHQFNAPNLLSLIMLRIIQAKVRKITDVVIVWITALHMQRWIIIHLAWIKYQISIQWTKVNLKWWNMIANRLVATLWEHVSIAMWQMRNMAPYVSISSSHGPLNSLNSPVGV